MTEETLAKKILEKLKNSPKDEIMLSDLTDVLESMDKKEEWGLLKEYNKQVFKYASKNLKERGKEKDCITWRRSFRLSTRYSFDSFCRYIELDQPANNKFYAPRQHYLKTMVAGYQAIFDKEIDVLTVSQPKRTGKSQTEILYVIWVSGLRPNNATLMEGCGDALVGSFYKGCLEYLLDDRYLYKDAFPDSPLISTDAKLKSLNLRAESRFPTIMCRSIEATQVGLSEATNVLVLDDCVDGHTEALNETALAKKWEVISGDVIGRALEGTPIVFTGTRYNPRDPIGMMQERAELAGMRLRKIEIPALDPITDESNYTCTDRNGNLIFTTAFFRNQREFLGSGFAWWAEFQQNPIEAAGLTFPIEELRRYKELPQDRQPDAIIAACDPADVGSDSCVLLIGYLYGDDCYIEDVVYDNSPASIVLPQVVAKLRQHNVVEAVIESNSEGLAFSNSVELALKKFRSRTTIKRKKNTIKKRTRIEYSSTGIKKYFLFKDRSIIKRGSQYEGYLNELTRDSRTGKNAHDDAADATSLLERFSNGSFVAKGKTGKRPF